jgi:hypothetical protein
MNQQAVRNFDFVVTPGRWYLIEAQIEFWGSWHTAEVRINGVAQGSIGSAGSHTTVRSVIAGSYSAKTHNQDYGDIAVEVHNGPIGWLADPAAGGTGEVVVEWYPVVDPGSGLLEYQVWRNGSWLGWTPAGTTRYVDANPPPGSTYQIRAVDRDLNRSGWSPRASMIDPTTDNTPPPAPTAVTLADARGVVTLSWAPVTDSGGSGLREYAIWRNGSWLGWVHPWETSFVDHDPTAGARYYLRAYDNALNRSPRSATVSR